MVVPGLDYTKGLPHKSMRQLIDKYPQNQRRVVLTQIAPPTRESVEAYSDVRQELESLPANSTSFRSTISYRSMPRARAPARWQERSPCTTPRSHDCAPTRAQSDQGAVDHACGHRRTHRELIVRSWRLSRRTRCIAGTPLLDPQLMPVCTTALVAADHCEWKAHRDALFRAMATIHSPLLSAAKVVGAQVPVRLPYTGIRTVGCFWKKLWQIVQRLSFRLSSPGAKLGRGLLSCLSGRTAGVLRCSKRSYGSRPGQPCGW